MRPLLAAQTLPRRVPRIAAFYMEVEGAKGFSVESASRLEAVVRRLVPQLTGGRFQLTRWETGSAPRDLQSGWIMIEPETSMWIRRAARGRRSGRRRNSSG